MGSRDSLMHYGLPPIGTYLKPTFIGYLGKKITSLMSFMMEACLVVKMFVILHILLERYIVVLKILMIVN